MANEKKQSVPSVADATTQLEASTRKLDTARQAVVAAEKEYDDACATFDAAVAQTRKNCSR